MKKKFRNFVILVLLVVFPVFSGCIAAAPMLMYGAFSSLAWLGGGLLALGGLSLAMKDVREKKVEKSTSPTPTVTSVRQLSWGRVDLKLGKNLSDQWDYASTLLRSRGVKVFSKSNIVIDAVVAEGFVVVVAHKGEKILDSVKVRYKTGNEKGALGAAIMALR